MESVDKKAFRKLQNKWYDKLKKAGFEDIEERHSPREMLKAKHVNIFKTKTKEARYELTLTYYLKAGHFLTNYPFESKQDKAVWALHSEGIAYRPIGEKLKLHRYKVHEIVVRLRKVMFASNY